MDRMWQSPWLKLEDHVSNIGSDFGAPTCWYGGNKHVIKWKVSGQYGDKYYNSREEALGTVISNGYIIVEKEEGYSIGFAKVTRYVFAKIPK